MIVTRHSCTTSNIHFTLHCICHTELKYKFKNIFFNGNQHFSLRCFLTSTFTDANKTCMSWFTLTYLIVLDSNTVFSETKKHLQNRIHLLFLNPLQHVLYRWMYIFHEKLWKNCSRIYPMTNYLSLCTQYSHMHWLSSTRLMYVMVYSVFTQSSVSWFRDKTLRSRCGTEEIHFRKIMRTRH
jgi:hypothetical protein